MLGEDDAIAKVEAVRDMCAAAMSGQLEQVELSCFLYPENINNTEPKVFALRSGCPLLVH